MSKQPPASSARRGREPGPHDPERRRPSRRQRLFRTLSALVSAAVVVTVVLVVDHLHKEPPAGGAVHPAVHYTVGLTTCTFTDPSRRTENFYTGESTAGRAIPTEIRYPTVSGQAGLTETPGAHPALGHGPFPLIVFAEGYDLTPADYAQLLDYWVRAGYVVVAPRFPDTDAAAVTAQHDVDTEADDINQPRDVAFVTRAVEADATTLSSACPLLHRLLVAGKIALAGQSDGAETVGGLAYDRNYVEAGLHFAAVAVMSGEAFGAEAASGPDPYLPGPPLLITQSATDTCNPPQLSTQLYSLVHQQAKWFLEIRSADHLPPYTGTDPAAFAVVASVTTRFFELEFSGSRPAAGFISYGDRSPSVAVLSTGASPPAIAPLTGDSDSCYLGLS